MSKNCLIAKVLFSSKKKKISLGSRSDFHLDPPCYPLRSTCLFCLGNSRKSRREDTLCLEVQRGQSEYPSGTLLCVSIYTFSNVTHIFLKSQVPSYNYEDNIGYHFLTIVGIKSKRLNFLENTLTFIQTLSPCGLVRNNVSNLTNDTLPKSWGHRDSTYVGYILIHVLM